MVYPFKGKIISNVKGWTTEIHNLEESKNNYAEWKKLNKKEYDKPINSDEKKISDCLGKSG